MPSSKKDAASGSSANKGPVIRDRPYADRLSKAIDGHPTAPVEQYGRLSWLKRELDAAGLSVSVETIRKWSSGEARPTRERGAILAKVLRVDEAWLSLGTKPADMNESEKRVRNAMADGAVNLIAGMIQIDGGHPAFPEPGKGGEGVDLLAIIKGTHHQIKVAMAREDKDGNITFVLPANCDDLTVLGVVRAEGLHFEIVKIPSDVIATHGDKKGGFTELTVTASSRHYLVGDTKLPLLKGFTAPL